MGKNIKYSAGNVAHVACQDCFPGKEWVLGSLDGEIQTWESGKQCEFCGESGKS